MVAVSACSSMADSDTWQATRKFYYTHINTPVTVDYSEEVNLSEAEELLSINIMKVDGQLNTFQKLFENLTQPPAGTDLQKFFTALPWLSGIAIIDSNGNIAGAVPERYAKNLDFTSLLEEPENKTKRDMRVVVHEDISGAEILVGRPVFDAEGELAFIFIAYFDVRTLLSYVEMDSRVFMFAGNTPVWTGDYLISETPLADVDLVSRVKSDPRGSSSNAQGNAIWLNRYFYHQPLVFAVMQH